MSRPNLTVARLVLVSAALITVVGLSSAHGEITVTPLEHDFGDLTLYTEINPEHTPYSEATAKHQAPTHQKELFLVYNLRFPAPFSVPLL